MKDENTYRQSGSKEQKMHKEFCQQNKIPTRYYRDKNAISVDFTQIDEFVKKFPTKLTAKDLIKVREHFTVDSNTLEELYYKELLAKIKRKLPSKSKNIFLLMVKEFNQTQIAKRLKISSRTVRRHVKKIRGIVRKILQKLS
jgi:RNA polymerase sigma factor (sigma-70 family)